MASNITLTGRFGTEPEAHAGEKGMRTTFRFASTEYEQGKSIRIGTQLPASAGLLSVSPAKEARVRRLPCGVACAYASTKPVTVRSEWRHASLLPTSSGPNRWDRASPRLPMVAMVSMTSRLTTSPNKRRNQSLALIRAGMMGCRFDHTRARPWPSFMRLGCHQA